ncbi:aconitase X catalytic domain-containing protein [Lipingzhangella sp. LS1_29]|uniref:Aconitase X catalytic domain-containing protein n=1 Tax=Lipingzhangella rawalii TaxID=2055835 RepID=A0ABU2H751_9ACTN|nr:aconitase X catalytic domain-containing protein [Lipingzhangella rawalii]MDS1271137.1 aconitase X catalytic domain-containing protein [Lipingzhangella rawalii]
MNGHRTGGPRNVRLTATELGMLHGDEGPAVALAMRIVTGLADAMDAPDLLPVTSAHVDSCLYHGRAGLDFAQRLVQLGGQVRVPTTLNVGSLDLLHPELSRADAQVRTHARSLMDAYTTLGARPTWTCAPYQSGHRPGLGEHVAWAESNAIVFANSVLGARTARYGDFLDICAALTGRAPRVGLHCTAARRGTAILDVSDLPATILHAELTYPLLGHLAGRHAGLEVPVFVGLPADTSEDRLKALGSAAASSGGVGMFHAVGITPEAPTLSAALGGADVPARWRVRPEDLADARRELTTAVCDRVDAVSLGTPHFSLPEFRNLAALLAEDAADVTRFAAGVEVYVSTSRAVLAQAEEEGLVAPLRAAGGTVVVDTCTYVTPILRPQTRVVLTNSAKWAYYAPANLGVQVVLANLAECVTSAQQGRVRLS